jgi:hypothetical protein
MSQSLIDIDEYRKKTVGNFSVMTLVVDLEGYPNIVNEYIGEYKEQKDFMTQFKKVSIELIGSDLDTVSSININTLSLVTNTSIITITVDFLLGKHNPSRLIYKIYTRNQNEKNAIIQMIKAQNS